MLEKKAEWAKIKGGEKEINNKMKAENSKIEQESTMKRNNTTLNGFFRKTQNWGILSKARRQTE